MFGPTANGEEHKKEARSSHSYVYAHDLIDTPRIKMDLKHVFL